MRAWERLCCVKSACCRGCTHSLPPFREMQELLLPLLLCWCEVFHSSQVCLESGMISSLYVAELTMRHEHLLLATAAAPAWLACSEDGREYLGAHWADWDNQSQQDWDRPWCLIQDFWVTPYPHKHHYYLLSGQCLETYKFSLSSFTFYIWFMWNF